MGLVPQEEEPVPSLFREPQATGIDSAVCVPNASTVFSAPSQSG